MSSTNGARRSPRCGLLGHRVQVERGVLLERAQHLVLRRPAPRRSACAGAASSRSARGCRGGRPCPRSRGRCRGRWCRWRCRATPRGLIDSRWYGMITRAAEMRRWSTRCRAREPVDLLLSTAGSTTTPLPITHSAGVEDARRHEVQLNFSPSTTTCGRRCCRPEATTVAAGEEIDDLTLALVAPLGADHHQSWHDESESDGAEQGRLPAAARRPAPPCAGPGP